MGYIKTKLCSIVLFEKHRISSMSVPESAYLVKSCGVLMPSLRIVTFCLLSKKKSNLNVTIIPVFCTLILLYVSFPV